MRKKWPLFVFLSIQMAVPAFAGSALARHEFAQVGFGSGGGGDFRTVFLILNQRDEEVPFRLTFLRTDPATNKGVSWSVTLEGGEQVAHVDGNVPAGGSFRITTAKTGALQVGWARLVAEESVGAQTFFEIFEEGTENLLTQAAVESAGPVRAADLFVEDRGATLTGLAVVSLSSVGEEIVVELTLKDENGAVIATGEIKLGPLGHRAAFLRFLGGNFSNLPAISGTLFVRASGPISLTTLQQTGLLLGILPPVKRLGS